MSYILDALRRADAERERGSVPGLHSQPLPTAESTVKSRSAALPWLAGAGVAVLVAGAAGWLLMRAPTPPPAPTVVADKAARPAPVAVPAPTPESTPASIAAPPIPAAVAPPAASAPVFVPPPAPPAVAPPARTATQPPAAKPAAAAAPSPIASPASAPAPSPAASDAGSRIIAFEQLPEDVRRQLPAVSIGGAIYSDTPSARLLIVAGQLLREGDPVAPGVMLEQIKPRSAVLRWKALRYEVSF